MHYAKKPGIVALLGILAVGAFLSLADAAAAGQTRIAVSDTASVNHPWNKGARAFADFVNEKAGDRFKVDVFPNGVLCQSNWEILIEMTQSGSSQIGIEALTAMASIVPELSAISLPFLFATAEQLEAFLASDSKILAKWLDKFEQKNLKILAITPRPFRQFSNNRRLVKTPADLAGMKVRIPSNNFFLKIYEALGAKPVPLPSGEIYSAIQLGTVNGEDNSISGQFDLKTHEVSKFFTVWDYIADASLMFINKDLYDSLGDADKALFREAAGKFSETNVGHDAEYIEHARREMEKAGVQFYDMPPAGKEPFQKLTESLYKDIIQLIGEDDWREFRKELDALK